MMVAENAPGISQVMMHAFVIALNDGRLIVDHLFEGGCAPGRSRATGPIAP